MPTSHVDSDSAMSIAHDDKIIPNCRIPSGTDQIIFEHVPTFDGIITDQERRLPSHIPQVVITGLGTAFYNSAHAAEGLVTSGDM